MHFVFKLHTMSLGHHLMALGHDQASDSFSLLLDRSLCVLIIDTAYHSSASILTSTCTGPEHRAKERAKENRSGGKIHSASQEKYTKEPWRRLQKNTTADTRKRELNSTFPGIIQTRPQPSCTVWRCPLGWGFKSNLNTKKKSCLYLMAWQLA